MGQDSDSQAWVRLAPAEDLAPRLAAMKHPYYFGFVANMSRLIMTQVSPSDMPNGLLGKGRAGCSEPLKLPLKGGCRW